MTSDVAVIVPAYQAAREINAALASIAGQTTPPDEIVVVDDGSTDDTFEIARRWEHLLPVTVLRHSQTIGAAAARRSAIAGSQSPLLALLDADDVWLPNHLASLLGCYRTSGGIVSGDAYRWMPEKGLLRTTHRDQNPIPAADRQAAEILRRNFVFGGALFSRARYEKAGGFRDGVAEDWDLWIRMIRGGAVVHPTETPSMLYRLSSTSVSRQQDVMDTYVAVLEYALDEAQSERERLLISSTLRWMLARRQLARTQAAAASRDRSAVWAEALPVPARMKAEALALRACPRLSTRVGRAMRSHHWR